MLLPRAEFLDPCTHVYRQTPQTYLDSVQVELIFYHYSQDK